MMDPSDKELKSCPCCHKDWSERVQRKPTWGELADAVKRANEELGPEAPTLDFMKRIGELLGVR